MILVVFYYTLRVCSYIELKGNGFQFAYLTDVLNNIWKITEPLVLTPKNILISFFVSMFIWMVIATYSYQNKRNVQENTYGNSDWEDSKATLQYRDKKYENNLIFTATEMFSKNMQISKRNRNVVLVGRPGTGKSRFYFKPNILNANGETIIITDPKGELLRDCAMSLVNTGYDIKVLNLVEKWKSDHFNPLMYIRKINKHTDVSDNGEWIAEDDVMTLINTIMLNTQSETIESNTGDPFWEKAEMVFLQAIIYYIIDRKSVV